MSFISAFGAHKSKHLELDAEVDSLAQAILQFLEATAERSIEAGGGKQQEMIEQSRSLRQRINEKMKTSEQDESRQQLLLLRNICELTTAIMEKSEFLQMAV